MSLSLPILSHIQSVSSCVTLYTHNTMYTSSRCPVPVDKYLTMICRVNNSGLCIHSTFTAIQQEGGGAVWQKRRHLQTSWKPYWSLNQGRCGERRAVAKTAKVSRHDNTRSRTESPWREVQNSGNYRFKVNFFPTKYSHQEWPDVEQSWNYIVIIIIITVFK